MGDVVFVELPTEGTEVAQGGEFSFLFALFISAALHLELEGGEQDMNYDRGELMVDAIGAVESVKAASDIYAPVSGVIEAINETLADQPSLLNKKPQSDGMYLIYWKEDGD